MSSHLKIALVTFLLMFILTEEFKSVLAKGGGRLKPKVKLLEKSIAELKATMVEQEARTTEQEAKIEALEDCDGKYKYPAHSGGKQGERGGGLV